MTSEVTPNVPQQPLGAEELDKIIMPDEPWSDSRAKDFAKRTFNRYEQYRYQQYDKGYRRCDDTFMAKTTSKTWEGTRIPRASIPNWQAVTQIEALLPHVVGALFADDFPFECFPTQGATWESARAVRNLLRAQIDDLNPDVMGMTLREIVTRAFKSAFIYGLGPVEFGWQMAEKRKLVYARKAVPGMMPMRHPMTGQTVMVPSGQLRWQVDQDTKTYTVSRPKVQNIDVWDYYFDPNLKSHNPQEGQGVAIRQLLPVSYLKQVCLPEFGYNLPSSDKDWKELANQYKSTMAEVSRGWGELARGNFYNPSLDQNVDPADARVEVVRFVTPDRNIWLLGRDFLCYNQPNELGVINLLNLYYITVPGRHIGLSVCDLLEGNQKLVQAILEARIDELALMIHPQIISSLGAKTNASVTQKRIRPGGVWEVSTMAEKPERMEMGNVTVSAFAEVQAAETRDQKATGITDLAALGAPASGGNSANRTATGINTQTAATGVRIGFQIENAEDQFITPLLNMLLLLNQKYQDPNQPLIPVNQPDGKLAVVDPVDIMNASVSFKLKASQKLRIRRLVAGGGLEAVLQFLAGIQQALTQQGMTADWNTAGQLIADAYGLPDNTLIRPMTDQEQQRLAQMMMAPEMAKQQLQDSRLEKMHDISESKDDAGLIGDIFKKLITPEVAAVIAKSNGAPEVLELLKKKVDKPKQLGAKK